MIFVLELPKMRDVILFPPCDRRLRDPDSIGGFLLRAVVGNDFALLHAFIIGIAIALSIGIAIIFS